MKNKCEYCDQKFAARCATIHEEKKYDFNVNFQKGVMLGYLITRF